MADLNTLVVTLKQRIREQVVPYSLSVSEVPNQGVDSQQNMLAFLVTTWIEKVALVAPDGITEGPAPDVPLELFLYQKLNNVMPPNGSAIREPLLSGKFMRCLEPQDLDDPAKPVDTYAGTLFGSSERLKWVKNPLDYTGTDQLLPSGTSTGAPLTIATAENPYSPLSTKNTVGYYVSRIHQARSLDPAVAAQIRDNMIVSLRAFAAKYNSRMSVLFEQLGSSVWINNGFGS